MTLKGETNKLIKINQSQPKGMTFKKRPLQSHPCFSGTPKQTLKITFRPNTAPVNPFKGESDINKKLFVVSLT